MDKPKTTAKDFFLWAGAMVAFYWSAIAFIFLIFNYIDYAFPNALSYYYVDPYQSGISFEMASIIVLLPIYLLLMRFIRKDIAQDSSRGEIWVRRWLLILTLFIAGITIAIDIITLLTTFLNGEALTVAFLLKVLVIFLIAATVFMHFIADLKGYWTLFPQRRNYVVIAVGILAVVTIISGFFIVGTPQQARLYRFDDQKVNDLTNIQWQVTNYFQAKQKLPMAITDVYSSLDNNTIPVDAQTGEQYIYSYKGNLSFQLCATFNAESRESQAQSYDTRKVMPTPVGIKRGVQDNWAHSAGEVCFNRTIDPDFYKPVQ